MNAKTLTALKGSIKKWELIYKGKGQDNGCSNCPLCQVFQPRPYCGTCTGCPVMAKTNQPFCWQTPYIDWSRNNDYGKASTKTQKLLALAELKFLKSLLPKRKKKKPTK